MIIAINIVGIEPVRVIKIFPDVVNIRVIRRIKRVKELLEAKDVGVLLFDQFHHFQP